MSKQTINIGASPNDGTGTPLRTSFDYTNQNFTEIYTALGGGVALPGATTQVIFNDGGTNLAGDAGLVYNKTTDALTVAGLVTAGSATITGDLTAARWFLTGGSLPGLGNGNPFAYRIGGGGLGIGAATETGTTAPIVFYCGAGGVEQYRIAPLGVNTWSDGAGGTRMTLNSTGLGVGVTPANDKLLVLNTIGINTATTGDLTFRNSVGTAIQRLRFTDSTGVLTIGSATGTSYQVELGGSTSGRAVTIDNNGNLLVGKTATNLQVVGCELKANGTVFSTLVDTTDAAASSYQLYSTGAAAYRFYVGLGGTVFATNTTISAISDARLKENVQDLDVGLAAILALKPRKFDWKAGKGKDIKGDRGFIAQEFETVFPNLVDEWKDPAPEGEAPYKSVRQDLIPVLVKAIQELTSRVQTLEAR
jgi:hypothetical protein